MSVCEYLHVNAGVERSQRYQIWPRQTRLSTILDLNEYNWLWEVVTAVAVDLLADTGLSLHFHQQTYDIHR